MTPEQCRAARAIINMTQTQAAKAAGVSDVTIRNYETGKTELQPATRKVLQAALESAGVTFLGEGETTTGGPGVRLR